MEINLNSVMDTPGARELALGIMREIGLGGQPSAYAGPSAYDTRVAAAAALRPVIKARAEENATISPPIDEILNLVQHIAEKLEKNRLSLVLTREAAWIAICGHIWLGHLIAHHDTNLSRITARAGVMTIIKTLAGHGSMYGGSSCAPSGSCGDDCGGCGGGCHKP